MKASKQCMVAEKKRKKEKEYTKVEKNIDIMKYVYGEKNYLIIDFNKVIERLYIHLSCSSYCRT